MNWIKIEDSLPDNEKRVLVYSPEYEGLDDGMLFRIINGQFINATNEVTHWAYLKSPQN